MVINSLCLIDKKELAIPRQTVTGKEFSNPLMAGILPKTISAKEVVISESSVRNDLLFDNEDGITCLINDGIFENLTLMGSKSTGWNEFSTNLASAVICLAKGQKFNVSKLIFDVSHAPQSEAQIKQILPSPSTYQRQPLKDPNTYRRTKRGRITKVPQPGGSPKKVGDEAVYKGEDDRVVRAATTASSLEAKQESSIINKTQPTATLNKPSPQGTGSGSGHWRQDTMGVYKLRLGLKVYLICLVIHLSQEVTYLEVVRT
ncbi:hypothetical protein Tco_1423628, partial [Tanacetum coccineum]